MRPEKVFCDNCIHFSKQFNLCNELSNCKSSWRTSFANHKQQPSKLNKNNDCLKYKV